ncbi:helix-turn-helix domain-containing protein [Tunicatimonas pelagia]|uniref:helix-turn-helix domain-containing protein n=1 Tax=Tunicatimonas pelagia TaxID=931531 RepID=UPI0026662DB3|nr:helix-turn-helix domain-containing protein [Tunicatimonas pelagia]WKN40736.1 helix-turn-helix domain-containing protein [Tunicatimonas pelagia]
MGKIRKIELSEQERTVLLAGYHQGRSSAFRQRCHMILLKSEGRTSQDVAAILGSNLVSVNNWLTRYEQEGIAGLSTRPGRGRKPILDLLNDKAKVREIVQQERQRLKRAKLILEEELDKQPPWRGSVKKRSNVF